MRSFSLPLRLLLTVVAVLPAACDRPPPYGAPDEKPKARDGIHLPVVGHGPLGSRWLNHVVLAGGLAYTTTLCCKIAGIPGNVMFTWDISGAAPVLRDSVVVDTIIDLGRARISDDGSLLVTSVPRAPWGRIMIFDRSTPARPALLSKYVTRLEQGAQAELTRVGGRHYAIVLANHLPGGLSILDVTDPRQPREVFFLPMRPAPGAAIVRDSVLFVSRRTDGLTIFDIGGGGRGGKPANPVEITTFKPADSRPVGPAWWFHNPVDGSKRFLFIGTNEIGPGLMGRCLGSLFALDVTDLARPRAVASYNVPLACPSTFVMDEAAGYLYVGFSYAGIRVLDVRGDLGVCDASSRSGGLCDMKLADREAGVALIGEGIDIWSFALGGRYLYVSNAPSGLYKIDVSALAR